MFVEIERKFFTIFPMPPHQELFLLFKTSKFLRIVRYCSSLVRVNLAFPAAYLISDNWFPRVSAILLSNTIRQLAMPSNIKCPG